MSTPIPAAQRWMLGMIALAAPLSIWGAVYPENTWLEAGPVALGLPLTIWALRRWPLSNLAAGCICAFTLLHLIGAHWSYSFVPYDSWLQGLLGTNLSDAFGWQRNHYDRLVHLLYGMLAVPVLAEIAMRKARLGSGHSLLLAVLCVMATGSLYEIFEWSLTLTIAPESAGAYNGEQGDIFDAQKDMALAVFGALVALPFAVRHLRTIAGMPEIDLEQG